MADLFADGWREVRDQKSEVRSDFAALKAQENTAQDEEQRDAVLGYDLPK